MLIIFLLMALHPHIQKKAQQEIDSITGGGQRTVALEDRPNMPYMRALLKEVARWHVVVPMSTSYFAQMIECLLMICCLKVFHVAQRRQIFIMVNHFPPFGNLLFTFVLGYTIPADTIVVPNIW